MSYYSLRFREMIRRMSRGTIVKGQVDRMETVSFAFVTGLMVAAILIVCILKYANKDGRVKTEYDERQTAVRGKAYRYAFYAEIFAQVVIMWILMTGMELPIEDYALLFIGVILGCMVLCAYCIWHDVYWGMNNDHRRFYIIFIVATILNAFPVVAGALRGTLIENGKIGMPLLNIAVLVMMAAVFIELFIKSMMDKKAEKTED